jgi:hypothetical protein
LAVVAFAAFAISIAASVYVLLPRKAFVFSLVGSNIYEELYEFRDDLSEVQRRLSYDLDRFWEANYRAMQAVSVGFASRRLHSARRSCSFLPPSAVPCS